MNFRCKKDEKSVEAAKKSIEEAEVAFKKLRDKNAQAEKMYREKQNREYIGGYKKWSPQGVVSITPKEWREWKEYCQTKNGWSPLFGAIHKNKKTD